VSAAILLASEIVTATPAPRRVKKEKLDVDVDSWASRVNVHAHHQQRQQANVPSLTDEVETELAKYWNTANGIADRGCPGIQLALAWQGNETRLVSKIGFLL